MSRPQTTPTIDWEETMITTEQNAKVAAKMTERAVGALVEVLDKQESSSKRVSELAKAVEEIRARPVPTAAPPPNRPSSPTPRRQRPHTLPLIVAFVAGAACVGFFASW
ncbi:hypothetical protein AVJ23_21640 [Pseudoponticoccus marisrubri]|uniref:Uncharacterized protein n=1 Tax=Pseudoponticoccus marisrubri TaxID=1685382 RepID=A0A0W7WDF1_9RHOB|nr:hypothetical protein AVJ23_21640 [Pseudoponticoccus marisrubri]